MDSTIIYDVNVTKLLPRTDSPWKGSTNILYPTLLLLITHQGYEQGLLRFTRELNEHRSAERLLQVLPSKLRDLISANIFFIAATVDGSQATFSGSHTILDYFVDENSDAHVSILPGRRRPAAGCMKNRLLC